MTALLALRLLTAGDCSYYADGVMEATLQYRLDRGQVQPCAACVGYVALLDCDRIGGLVWLDWGDVTEGPYLVTDCAQAEHRAGLRARGRAVEVDWPTARRHHMAGPMPVQVFWQPAAADCATVAGAC